MKDRPVRIGLVGYGAIGLQHARAIDRCPSAQLSAIAVLSPKSQATAHQNHPDTIVLGDPKELLHRPDIDLIDVTVPFHLRFPVAKASLETGKHVVLEKPMALEVSHCDELLRLAQQKECMLAIGHEMRLSPLWREVKRLITSDTVGHVQHILIKLARLPYRQGAPSVWRPEPQHVASWLFEEPMHFFDLACWYFAPAGTPQAVYARANAGHTNLPGLHDNFTVLIEFAGSTYATISQTLAINAAQQSLTVTGTKGTIEATWRGARMPATLPTYQLQYRSGEETHEVDFSRAGGEPDELEAVINALCQSVRRGVPPPCTAEEGRFATLLGLAAVKSLETRQRIEFAKFINTVAVD